MLFKLYLMYILYLFIDFFQNRIIFMIFHIYFNKKNEFEDLPDKVLYDPILC